ncbi:MAG: hypothetical protein FWH57_03530 [Oscillospiraceae bacterium]|nr:hypothetical protein [Oscillospiraceae bacterium]
MANYDDLKKKAKDALETIADVSVEAYKLAEEKAKVFARKAKLNAEISREKATIRKLKLDIGGVYYDLHKDDADDALKELCASITASLDSIAAKRCELEDLKRNGGDDECCAETEEEPTPEDDGGSDSDDDEGDNSDE